VARRGSRRDQSLGPGLGLAGLSRAPRCGWSCHGEWATSSFRSRPSPGSGSEPGCDVSADGHLMPRVAGDGQMRVRPALAMDEREGWTVGTGKVAVAPRLQGHERGVEVQPFVGQAVLVPAALSRLAIRRLLEHTGAHQRAQPVGQHLAGDRRANGEIVETPDAVERLPQDVPSRRRCRPGWATPPSTWRLGSFGR